MFRVFIQAKVYGKLYESKTFNFGSPKFLEELLFVDKRWQWKRNKYICDNLRFGVYIIIKKGKTKTRLPFAGLELPGNIAYIGYGVIEQDVESHIFIQSRANQHNNDLISSKINSDPDSYEIYILNWNCPEACCESLEAYLLYWAKYELKLEFTKDELIEGKIFNKKQQPAAFKKISKYLNLELFDYDCSEERQD